MNLALVVSLLTLLLPWTLRRLVLTHVLGYSIHKTARIGFSLLCPAHLDMGPKSYIGHLTVCKTGVQLLRLGEGAIIGNLNWISGIRAGESVHFRDQATRRSELIVHEHASITNRHFIDCSATVSIGHFSVFAGIRSIILSHTVDLETCKQTAMPITIGEFCFVGTASVILPGAALPSYSILGANSLLNKSYVEPYYLYGGSPARPIKKISSDYKYFSRTTGYVE